MSQKTKSGMNVPLVARVDRSAYANVYEPREDTFLLLDALDADRELLTGQARCVVVEVGPGSGVVSAHLSRLLSDQSALFLGVDINPDAARVARQTFDGDRAGRPHAMECVVGDLCAPLASRLSGQIDVLVFNPPYVPTDDDEVGHGDLRAAWAGGRDGMAVTSRFLPSVATLLSPTGLCYLVLVQENDPVGIARLMAQQYGLLPKQVARKTAKNERLSVWRFSRRPPPTS